MGIYIKEHQGGQNFAKIRFVARPPPKLGPDCLGTVIGGSGVKFRVGLHPPEVRRLQFDHKLVFDICWFFLGRPIVLLDMFPLPYWCAVRGPTGHPTTLVR